MPASRSTLRTLWVSVRALAVFTALTGVAYTALVLGIGQLAMPSQANGSLVRDADGDVVGSALIGQAFVDADGAPLPQYFQTRPSAAGDGYDGTASSGSNRGPESPELVADVEARIAAVAALEGVAPGDVPADAVTASGSGLDPHISPAYAAIQVDRVADARGLDPEIVEEVVDAHTAQPIAGVIGEPTVDVLGINLSLDELEG